MRRGLSATLVVLFLTVVSPVRAVEWSHERLSVDGWTGAAFGSDAGDFTHCVISSRYKSGIELMFSVLQDYSWKIVFKSDEFKFTKGQSFEITYFIDSNRPQVVEATAMSTKFLVAVLPSKTAVFDEFRLGNLLTVIAAGRSYRFKLDGTSKALSALLACVGRNKGKRFVASASATSPTPAVEAVKFIANVFAGPGFEGYRLLTDSDLKKRDLPRELKEAAVTWVGPNTFGTLHILPKRALASAADAMPAAISDDSKSCRGKFGSGSSNETNSEALFQFFTACSPADDRSYSVFYTIVRLADGSYYRIASMSFDSPEPARLADESIREAAEAILK